MVEPKPSFEKKIPEKEKTSKEEMVEQILSDLRKLESKLRRNIRRLGEEDMMSVEKYVEEIKRILGEKETK